MALLIALGCGRTPDPPPTPRPISLPTVIVSPLTPVPTRVPEPTPSPTGFAPPVFVDPFAAFYATERDGIFVTSRHPAARYYYRWDDRRWYGVDDRVWFRTVDDLLFVFPARIPAP